MAKLEDIVDLLFMKQKEANSANTVAQPSILLIVVKLENTVAQSS